jgi:hypothetical protein
MRSKGSIDTIMTGEEFLNRITKNNLIINISTTGEELLNRIIRKKFNDNKYYYGRILSMRIEVKKYSDLKENMFHVLFEDEDELDILEKDIINLVVSFL